MDETSPNLDRPAECDHDWKPVSFRFETQLLDRHGRVNVRQPDLDAGRVYMVCLLCATHTYIETQFVGYRLEGPRDRSRQFHPASNRPYTDWPEGEGPEEGEGPVE